MSRVSRSIAVGMACVAVATFSFRWLSLTDLTNDHFDHVARAFQVVLGDWPVRDFVDPGFTLTYLVSAAGQAIVGNPFLSEALIFASGFAVAAALSFRAGVLASGSVAIALLVVALQVGTYPRTYSYPKLLLNAVAVTVAWWVVARPLTARRLAALAAMTAVAYFFRHDHGVYIGISAIVLLVVNGWHHGPVRIARDCGIYAALTLGFMLPHLAYVQWASGLRTYFAVALGYSRTEALLNPYVVPRFAWPATPDASGAFLFWAYWLIPLFAAALLVRGRVVGYLKNQTPQIAMVIGLAVAVNAGLVRDPLLPRLPDGAVPQTILGAWLIASLWRWPTDRARRVALRIAVAASVIVMTVAVFSAFDTVERVRRTRIWQGPEAVVERWKAVNTDLHEDFPSMLLSAVEPLALFFDYVRQCTSADDRLLFVGYEPEVYVLTRRGFAGGHMMFLSGYHSAPDEQALTVQRLSAQRVPFVLIPSVGRDGFRRNFSQVWNYVRTRYVPMTSIETDEGPIEILLDASRGAPPATDRSGDWPCLITAPRR